jgi:hypothetical protein
LKKTNSPDDAAVREVLEKTGVKVELVGERREDFENPDQLHRPAGVPLETIGPGRQHIDLIYFARPRGPTEISADYNKDRVGWYGPIARMRGRKQAVENRLWPHFRPRSSTKHVDLGAFYA